MGNRRLPKHVAIALTVALVGGSTVLADTVGTTPPQGIRPKNPTAQVFTGATIVVSPTQTIERGMLVIRDGRVVSVGPEQEPPAGAFVRDASGKFIYPGFIDPYTEYGLDHVDDLNKEKKKGAGPKYTATRVGGDGWNDAIHADRDWVTEFKPDRESAEELMERGVTVVQAAKLDGIFRGRAFVASLADGLPNDLVLVPYGPQFVSFDKGSSQQSYPSSLMGSIALIRQALLDADWYTRAHAAYEQNRAQELPEFNRAIAALATNDGPLLFETTDELSLLRAARLGAEFSQPMMHVGSNQEYNRIEAIRALDQPIILPLSFPEAPAVQSYEQSLDATLAELRHWERAPSNAAALENSGIRFAFTGHDLAEKEDALKNLRRAVRRGLTAETALAALTTVPAQLCGLSDEIGTLDAGMRANFFIADADLLKEKSRIYGVWIDGKQALELIPLNQVDVVGSWELKLGKQRYELTLSESKGKTKGTLSRDEDETSAKQIELLQDRLTFHADLEKLGGSGIIRFAVDMRPESRRGIAIMPDGERNSVTLRALEKEKDAEDKQDGKADRIPFDEQPLVSRQTFPNLAFGFEALPTQEDVLVRGATIWTLEDDAPLANADLLVVDGKIAAVGPDLELPDGVRVIDAKGKHVTPGMIDEHAHIAISRGVNEGSHAVTAEVRIGDVVDSDQVSIYRALAGGTTTAQLLHGSANPIGGQAQVIKLRWGQSPEQMKFDAAPPTIKFALGENVKQSNWGAQFRVRYPQSRMGVESIMRDSFIAAREYERSWDEYLALSAGERDRTVPPRRNLQLDTLLEILDRERFVHCHSYVQSEILMLMRLAEESGFRIQTFTHILEGYKVASEMAQHGAGGSTFADWWAYKFEVYDAIPYNTCLMHERGVVSSINSDSSEVMRRLNQEAAKSVMYCGMDEVEALKLASLNSAVQLRVDDRVGSLAVGKDADFVIWNGHPLSIYGIAEQTWVDGVKRFDRERDAELRAAISEERQALFQRVLEYGNGDGSAKKATTKQTRTWDCNDVEDVWHAQDR